MTIQEMLKEIDHFLQIMGKLGVQPLTPNGMNDLYDLQDSLARISCFLPKFVPMHCKNCKHTGCNRKRERGVCSEYEVQHQVQ